MNFDYSGRRLSGQKITGKIEAKSVEEALRMLEAEGYLIYDIEETKPWNKDIVLNKRLNHKAFIIFLRQYATLIASGIPIADATKTMQEQTNNYALRIALKDVHQRLEQGESLSSSSSHHPKVFPNLLVHMIEAGEASGKLDEILDQMATYYEKQYQNRQKVISALLYPSIVAIITLLLSIALLVFVVPQFISMFESFGQDLPAFTLFVLKISEITGKFWWLIPLLIAGLVLLYRYVMKNARAAFTIDGLKIRIPIFGQLIHKGALVRATQTLSTLFHSGVPILQAVEITEKVVGNLVLRDLLEKSRESLEVGESMTTPMKAHWAVPPLVIQMIEVGEKTGSLDAMLLKVAGFYEAEVDQLSDRIKTLIEPLIIIMLAGVVGSIILAVVIPMFSMFENIQ